MGTVYDKEILLNYREIFIIISANLPWTLQTANLCEIEEVIIFPC